MPEPMQTSLQSAREIIDRLLLPESLVQFAVIGGAVLLGWWIARLVRPRFASSVAPEDLQGRLREIAWVAAPFAITLLILATVDGLLHAAGVPARFVDVAGARIKGWGTPISLIVWVFLSLHLLGWGDTVIGVLDGMGVTLGKTRISVWS